MISDWCQYMSCSASLIPGNRSELVTIAIGLKSSIGIKQCVAEPSLKITVSAWLHLVLMLAMPAHSL